jgi:hypothetical protein
MALARTARALAGAAALLSSGCLWAALGAQQAGTTPDGRLEPRLAVSQFRTFPRTARVPRLCVIHVFGVSSSRQALQQGMLGTGTYSFDPSALLASALAAGLKRTCASTAIDLRAADPSRVDFGSELAVVAEVTGVRLREDPFYIGFAEVTIESRTEVRSAADAPPLSVDFGRSGEPNPTSPNMATAVEQGLIRAVDAVNQAIFDHRERLAPRPISGARSP